MKAKQNSHITQINLGSNHSNAMEVNGILLFTVESNTGKQLWKTDGTSVGTTLITNI